MEDKKRLVSVWGYLVIFGLLIFALARISYFVAYRQEFITLGLRGFALIAGFSLFFECALIVVFFVLYRRSVRLSIAEARANDLADELQKFKMAVDNASDHIVITDPEGIVVYGNKAVERITGYSPVEAVGKKAGALWRQPMDQHYYENLWRVIKINKQEFIGEITNIKKDGTKYQAVISIAPVLNKEGAVIYFVGIERDVTKERELDKAKSEFISLASHQLSTPITSVSWNVEALLDGDRGPLTDGQREVLVRIRESSKNMAELVGGFLDATKMEASGFVIERGDVDLVQISDSVLRELASQIAEKEISVATHYGDAIPHLSVGTKTARIVLQNLLTNAIKYTPDHGSVVVTIARSNAGVSLAVKDSGYGIPDAVKSRIFTKLFRADNIKEKVPSGTGLGLYLLKMLVDKLGGKVWFESREGVGTTFYVDLLLQ